MTLKEIEKIIDEADYVGYPLLSKLIEFSTIDNTNKEHMKNIYRHANDDRYVFHYEDGEVYYYYKLNKETGEMKLLAKVDHIDKEKKIVKKKLDEMTKQEIIQVRDRICDCRKTCNGCSFAYSDKDNICKNMCDINFSWWKERYENLKDREFDVEVEE